MRVLVTGAQGFLGRHVVEECERQQIDVVAVGREIRDGVTLAGDLLDPSWCNHICTGIDLVLHCAGVKHNFVSHQQKPYSVMRSNILMAQYILDAAVAQSVARVVCPSSVVVYVESPEGVYSSSSETISAINVPHMGYAWSKRMTEMLCAYAQREHDVETWTPRLDTLYGPGEDQQQYLQLIPSIVNAVEKNSPYQTDSKDSQRTFIHVKDAARLLVQFALSDGPHPVNLTSGEVITLEKLCSLIEKEIDTSQSNIHFSDRVFHRVIKKDELYLNKKCIPLVDGLKEIIQSRLV